MASIQQKEERDIQQRKSVIRQLQCVCVCVRMEAVYIDVCAEHYEKTLHPIFLCRGASFCAGVREHTTTPDATPGTFFLLFRFFVTYRRTFICIYIHITFQRFYPPACACEVKYEIYIATTVSSSNAFF